MIETYKTVTGRYQPCVEPTLRKGNVHVTRGNDLRLEKSQVKYDQRKFVLLTGWRTRGTVCQAVLYLLTLAY